MWPGVCEQAKRGGWKRPPRRIACSGCGDCECKGVPAEKIHLVERLPVTWYKSLRKMIVEERESILQIVYE